FQFIRVIRVLFQLNTENHCILEKRYALNQSKSLTEDQRRLFMQRDKECRLADAFILASQETTSEHF
ncbi:MAG: hypothetical protein KJ714_02075, partial [Euryarchaeota archaeon]|nr:hypothetical protein [Euryarchaeota archaeon]